MIRVSEDARKLLSTLWSPEGEVIRMIPSPEADQGREFVFGHGNGEDADQIVQHGGRQVLRIAPAAKSSPAAYAFGAVSTRPGETTVAHREIRSSTLCW